MAASTCRSPAASAAKLFVQMSARRNIAGTSILDLLVPAQTRAFHISTNNRTQRPQQDRIFVPRQVPLPVRQLATSINALSRRAFSISPSRHATRAIFNPQEDDDGSNMILEITSRAAKRLQQIMVKDGNPDLALRIQVESGGCHGFQYIMSLTTLPSKIPSGPEALSAKTEIENSMSGADTAKEIVPSTTTSDSLSAPSLGEEDTVFAFVTEEGEKSEGSASQAKVVLDKPSLDLLKGSKVDFTQELIGSQFKIVDNPFATSSCGCGTSFDIKM